MFIKFHVQTHFVLIEFHIDEGGNVGMIQLGENVKFSSLVQFYGSLGSIEFFYRPSEDNLLCDDL